VIRVVIFDCFGVLTVDTWRKFQDEQNSDLRSQLRDLTHAYDSGHLNRSELTEQVADITGKSREEVYEASTPKIAKNTELFAYVSELRRKGLKIGILSNVNDSWITDKFLSEDEKEFFDAVVGSYQVRAAKPDPAMYLEICKQLDVSPDECIFVDDVEHYCEAGKDLGMKSVHYTDFISAKNEIERILQNK
jgi:putative hydrolase of the HAD superfamily